ncbi:hydrogenase subunit MbhD domain-containing protein [Halomonas sp. LS-001]
MVASIDYAESGLALCLVAAALACLFDRHLKRASGLFLLFALLMSLSWWQLGAPWLALAELVLGLVLTGGSFFYALKAFPATVEKAPHYDRSHHRWSHGVARAVLALAWSVMIGGAIRFLLPDMAYSLTEHPLIIAAVIIVATAMGVFALHRHMLRRLMAFNVLGSGVFLLLAGMAGTMPGAQALISVGLTIAWLGTLLGVLLIRQLVLLEGVLSLESDSDAARHAQ